MNDEAKRQIAEMARDHAIKTTFILACAACGYGGTDTTKLLEGLTEKLRRETFPTNDPAKSMLAADEIADAFFDLLSLDEQSLALLDQIAARRR